MTYLLEVFPLVSRGTSLEGRVISFLPQPDRYRHGSRRPGKTRFEPGREYFARVVYEHGPWLLVGWGASAAPKLLHRLKEVAYIAFVHKEEVTGVEEL